MARSPEQRGPFGRWLVAERKARGWTADDMRARLQEARGFAMAHSTYALLESGQRQPTEEQRRHLTAFLGSEPQPEQPATTAQPDLGALLSALTEQARLQTALVDELREQNRMLRLLLGRVTGPDDAAPSGPGDGPLPRQGLARAVRALVALESAEGPEAAPASDPDNAERRRTTR